MPQLRRLSFLLVLIGALFAAVATSPARADESSWNQITSSGTMRVSAIQGQAPYYSKDRTTGEWTGIFIDFARDMAKSLGVKLEIVETASWGTAVLDLQSGKTDVHFGVNPDPQKAKVLQFSNPVYVNTFNAICRKGVNVTTWADLNKPDMRIAIDIGSSHENITRRNATAAQITGYKTLDEVVLAVVSNKADCFIMTPLLGLSALKKNPSLGKFVIPKPVVFTPSCIVLPKQTDKRMMEFINVWIEYNRDLGQVRDWILGGLHQIGIERSEVPPEVQF